MWLIIYNFSYIVRPWQKINFIYKVGQYIQVSNTDIAINK